MSAPGGPDIFCPECASPRRPERPPAHDCAYAREALAIAGRLVALGERSLTPLVGALARFANRAASGETTAEAEASSATLAAVVAPMCGLFDCSPAAFDPRGRLYSVLAFERELSARPKNDSRLSDVERLGLVRDALERAGWEIDPASTDRTLWVALDPGSEVEAEQARREAEAIRRIVEPLGTVADVTGRLFPDGTTRPFARVRPR